MAKLLTNYIPKLLIKVILALREIDMFSRAPKPLQQPSACEQVRRICVAAIYTDAGTPSGLAISQL